MIRTMPLFIKSVDLVSILETAARVVYTWQARADERRHLASLPDHILKDVGLDRMQVATEVEKPFWRA